ncbi:Ribosomal protein S6, partial [Candidatus Magnetomorum sp. HK-1]
MHKYEVLFIIDPSLDDSHIEQIVEEIKQLLTKYKSSV